MVMTITEATRFWEKTLHKLEEKINEKKSFDQFIANSYLHEITFDEVIVVAETNVAKIVMSTKYLDVIKEVVNDLLDTPHNVRIVIKDELVSKQPENSTTLVSKETKSSYFEGAVLNTNLTFDNFVIGEFNQAAQQACLFVAQNSSNLFNPLFIYSHSGLGKTHLLHAIGNEIKATRIPSAKILYISANDFVEEYVKFVKAEKNSESIKDFFNDIDVLLLDDVQFMADKVKSQEMFFTVYESLIKKGKRIIVTSDRQPNDLKGIEDRIITRLNQGLTVKIDEPDRETCVKILKRKIKEHGLPDDLIDDQVIYFFAEKFSKDVRELEGSLNRLIFYCINLKQAKHISMDIAIEAVGSLKGGNAANQLSEQKIINIVCDYYNVTPMQITGKIRTGQIALARHVAMYLIRNNLDIPLKKIGDTFGGKDHTTVMSAITKVDKELKTNEQLKIAIAELTKQIKH